MITYLVIMFGYKDTIAQLMHQGENYLLDLVTEKQKALENIF